MMGFPDLKLIRVDDGLAPELLTVQTLASTVAEFDHQDDELP